MNISSEEESDDFYFPRGPPMRKSTRQRCTRRYLTDKEVMYSKNIHFKHEKKKKSKKFSKMKCTCGKMKSVKKNSAKKTKRRKHKRRYKAETSDESDYTDDELYYACEKDKLTDKQTASKCSSETTDEEMDYSSEESFSVGSPTNHCTNNMQQINCCGDDIVIDTLMQDVTEATRSAFVATKDINALQSGDSSPEYYVNIEDVRKSLGVKALPKRRSKQDYRLRANAMPHLVAEEQSKEPSDSDDSDALIEHFTSDLYEKSLKAANYRNNNIPKMILSPTINEAPTTCISAFKNEDIPALKNILPEKLLIYADKKQPDVNIPIICKCYCDYNVHNELMLQCSVCLYWQHGSCFDITSKQDVPKNYICVWCAYPEHVRKSMQFKNDQAWLLNGELPTANYHTVNPNEKKDITFLKKTHDLTGNLLELRRTLNSLVVKTNIAKSDDDPNLHLWHKKWTQQNAEVETKTAVKENVETKTNLPNSEAGIDKEQCKQNLLDHIYEQQREVISKLDIIESEVEKLEQEDAVENGPPYNMKTVSDMLQHMLKDIDTMYKIGEVNAVEHASQEDEDSS